MANKPNTTWHARINSERSLCGLSPQHGKYNIATLCSFFTSAPKDQCQKCLELIKARGYNIEKLRLQYRAIFDHVQQIDGGAAGQAMKPYLEQARSIVHHHA